MYLLHISKYILHLLLNFKITIDINIVLVYYINITLKH